MEQDYLFSNACRLDRLVSGVLVLARSSAAAAQLTEHIKQQFIIKDYLARVKVSNTASPQNILQQLMKNG